MSQDFPGEHLHILLDVARLGMRKAHDGFEKILTVNLGLGHCQWAESFQVAADSVLLFDSESDADKGFKQIDCVDTGDKVFILFFPPNATDADAAGAAILRSDRVEFGSDRAVTLCALELDQTSASRVLLGGPVLRHGVKVTLELEGRLVMGVHSIGVEVLQRSWGHSRAYAWWRRLLNGGRANQLGHR